MDYIFIIRKNIAYVNSNMHNICTVLKGGITLTFGEKLKHHRKEKGLTQSELAEKAGLGLRTIINYEKGSTYPQNREVYAILADILSVSPDYLHNENEEFLEAAGKKYGRDGKKQAQALVSEVSGLFSGGSLAQDDMDELMKAIQDAYWIAKEKNRKFSAKKKK